MGYDKTCCAGQINFNYPTLTSDGSMSVKAGPSATRPTQQK